MIFFVVLGVVVLGFERERIHGEKANVVCWWGL